MDRLDKIIAEHSAYSRREAAELIKRGWVRANGLPVKDPGGKWDPSGLELEVKGALLPIRPFNHLMLHKPEGYVSATQDPHEKTVLELIPPEELYPLPFPAGRLDKDATGLLLLTSDGDLCHRIISPKKEIYKTYLVRVQGRLDTRDKETLAAGLVLSSGESFLPAGLDILETGGISLASLKICEGRYHQVKRMMASLGKPVLSLKRTAIGSLQLDESLSPGAFKRLSPAEIEAVFQ